MKCKTCNEELKEIARNGDKILYWCDTCGRHIELTDTDGEQSEKKNGRD